MNEPESTTLKKYAGLIDSLLRNAPNILEEPTGSVFVERGLVLQAVLTADRSGAAIHSDRLARIGNLSVAENLVVRDVGGHTRRAYLPLLIWSWARAMSIAAETAPPHVETTRALRNWCRRLEKIVGDFAFPPAAIPATLGAEVGEAACAAMALWIAAPIVKADEWRPRAADFMSSVAARQRPNGALLLAGRSDNPETLWFHELVLLHALAGFAWGTGDERLVRVVNRAAEFHQDETEPDHATSQPWGITAFLLNPRTRPLADMALHSATAKSHGGLDGVSLMLLADCLYCLQSRPESPAR